MLRPLSRLLLLGAVFLGIVTLEGLVRAESPVPRPGSASSETPPGAECPLFTGVTVHRRAVTTSSPLAQRYFDQGLNFAYAFNHDEAIRSFEQALRFDPHCGMAWWGISLCRGPHINNAAMDESSSRAAWAALEQARSLRPGGSPVEQALMESLGARYLADPEQNIAQREHLNRQYAESLRRIHEQFPDDADIAVLFAESLMNLRPWDLWSDEGAPRPETPEIVALLEHVLEGSPSHPGANHLYIHAIEASSAPERAEAAAERLRTLMSGSGHMVHMPAHIDVRTGKWAIAADQNVRAMEVDAAYRQASPRQGFYHVYMVHNAHFLAFACMMEGRREAALQAARGMLASVPDDFLNASPALADPFMGIEYQVLVRFGRWDELLALPAPRADLPMTTAMWRFARATALAAKRDLAAAEAEQALFRTAVAAVPEDALGAINKVRDVLAVGEHTLAGELAFQRGDSDAAVEALARGVDAETRLLYMEPPEWIQPVRHSLGAVLSKAGRWSDAEAVYRADLQSWPENGWALYGLSQSLRAQGKRDEAEAVETRFKAAWTRADTQIGATCLCVERPQK